MKWPGFCGPSYISASHLALRERTINLYPERVAMQGAKNQFILLSTPGTTEFAPTNDTPGRGIYALSDNDRCFGVFGGRLNEVNADGTVTARNGATPLLTDEHPAQLSDNGDGGGQLLVVSGNRGGILDLTTNTWTADVVTGIAFCGMLNGRFLGLDILTSTLKISDAFAGLTWDPTQIFQRSAAADPWRAMLVRDTVVYLIGAKTGDIFYDAGNVPFPLAPMPGIRIRHGIGAPFSLTDLDSGPVWLSANDRGARQIVQVQQGYRAVPVSPHGVTRAISQYARVDDAVGWAYEQDGHEIYCLNFPSAGATWCWDPALGDFGWHERGRWNQATHTFDAWGPQYHAYAFGQHLVLDHRGSSVLRMSESIYTDNGAVLRRVRIPPALRFDGRSAFYNRIRLYLDTGIGLAGSGQGSNPQVMLRASANAGKTWGPERQRSAGRIGDWGIQAEWDSFGDLPDAQIEVSMSDPVPWQIVDCEADVELGTS